MPASVARPPAATGATRRPVPLRSPRQAGQAIAPAKDDVPQASTARLERPPSPRGSPATPQPTAADGLSAAAPILQSWPACMRRGEVGNCRNHKFSDVHTAASHDLPHRTAKRRGGHGAIRWRERVSGCHETGPRFAPEQRGPRFRVRNKPLNWSPLRNRTVDLLLTMESSPPLERGSDQHECPARPAISSCVSAYSARQALLQPAEGREGTQLRQPGLRPPRAGRANLGTRTGAGQSCNHDRLPSWAKPPAGRPQAAASPWSALGSTMAGPGRPRPGLAVAPSGKDVAPGGDLPDSGGGDCAGGDLTWPTHLRHRGRPDPVGHA